MKVLIAITSLALVFAVVGIYFGIKYLYLYRNLYKNFKSFLNFVEDRYIEKKDVILHNATVEALERAREKGNTFEIRAYTKLLERLKEGV